MRWAPCWPWWFWLVVLVVGLLTFVGVPFLAGYEGYWGWRSLYFRDRRRLTLNTRICVGSNTTSERIVGLFLVRWLHSAQSVRLPSGRRIRVWAERWRGGQVRSLVVRTDERERLLMPGGLLILGTDWVRWDSEG